MRPDCQTETRYCDTCVRLFLCGISGFLAGTSMFFYRSTTISMYLFTKLMEVKQARVTANKRKQSDTCALFSDHVLQRDRGRAVPLLSPRGHCSLRHLHGYLFPSCKCQSHAGRAELMSVAHAHMPHLPLLFQTSLFKLQPSFHSSLYCFTCFRPIKLNMDACVNIFDTDVRFSYVKSMLTRL